MSRGVPRVARWIVAASAPLVPAHLRDRWRRQWTAELEHRCADEDTRAGAAAFALGSVAHAFYLRREEATMRGLATDLAHAARRLLRRPGFSALTVATLAVGVGAPTAVFSLAEALLLRPLPLEFNDQLVRLYSRNPTRGFDAFSVSYPDFADLTSREDLFEAATLYIAQNRDLSGEGDPERVRAVAVHPEFFQTLGSPTRLGRVFSDEDHHPRNGLVVVLSEALWVARFGADETVIGRSVRVDGQAHTVVGVVSDRAAWPAGTDLWTPLQWGGVVPAAAGSRTNHTWQVIGRLRREVTVAHASEQVRAMSRTVYAAPDVDARDVGTEVIAVRLHSSESGEGPGPLFATLGSAVLFVLLIACMNASGLLLTRATARARELSLRSALGAGRARLALIVFGESALLSLLGGGLGVALGVWGLERAFRMAPAAITATGDVSLNRPVLAAGLGLSVLAALLAGLYPAARASRVSFSEALKEGSGKASQGRGGARLRRGLVVAQLALSLSLLSAAALTVRGLGRQLATDPGFDASSLISFTVRLPQTRYADDAQVNAYYADAVERLTRHPEVIAASSTSRLPLGAGGLSLGRAFIFDGSVPPPEGAAFNAAWIEVDPEYFETLGIRPVEGRAFVAEDRAGAPLVAIVNQEMAASMSAGRSMLGRRIRSAYDENLPREVVGVVPDLQINGVSRARRGAFVLVPREQSVRTSMAFLVRTTGDPSEMMAVVRRSMAELDADVALDQLQTLREAHAADLSGIRFLTTLFAVFGGLALLLAVSGVYGLVASSVAQRTQEIGVRMAMGATRGRVLREVLIESAWLAGIGLTVGLGLAYAAGRVLAVGMDGIATPEASTYVGAAALLGVAVLAASWIPASRATRVDPLEALRSE